MSSVEAATNPFVGGADGSYRTPVDLINNVIASSVSAVFGYKTYSQSDLLYSSLQSAPNAGYFFQEVDIRAGAGLAPLGYSSQSVASKPVGIVTPGYGLPYFASALSGADKRFLFNVAALSYDDKDSTLGSDFVTPLSVAKQLGFNVVSPVSLAETEQSTLLSLALAQYFQKASTVHLFDGVRYSKTFRNLPSTLENVEGALAAIGKGLSNDPSVDEIVEKVNAVSGASLSNFQYSGPADAETVFVTFGATESELFASIGAPTLAVRIALPFDTQKFVESIPASAKTIVVVGQSANDNTAVPSPLRLDVSAALFFHNRRGVKVAEHQYKPDFNWTAKDAANVAATFIPALAQSVDDGARDYVFYLPDNSKLLDTPAKIAKTLVGAGENVVFNTAFNSLVHTGVFQARITLSGQPGAATAAVAVFEDINLLNHIDIVDAVKAKGTIVYIGGAEVEKYPQQFVADIIAKDIKLVAINSEALAEDVDSIAVLAQANFYSAANFPSDKLQQLVASNLSQEQIHDLINANGDESNVAVYSSEQLPKPEFSEEVVEELPYSIRANAFTPNYIREQQEKINEAPSVTSTITELTKKLAFKEAYHVEKKLRPDLPLIKNHVIKVKENRRLTPADYDRNIFHIEFDISGTDLTYDIGEALGIHARNNEAQVLEFLQQYGLDPEQVVQVPNKDQPQFIESRTVLQVFAENLDIFGKPPKKFYESLIPFAADEEEKKVLQELITPAGAIDLKNYQEVEFYTYADIFQKFPSVRPELGDLINIVAPLKRREYSIASSQKMHPNEIHLLIVVVDWIDNQGRKRYGQASKYISDLKIGQELVVSVKPSVMKLPADPKAPVIMSGLGTGLAPFKAIVEEKLWQKQQGLEIGDIFLYLGSRHCRQEYLYGEVWEAYKDAGIITHIGAAFSRDQAQKIYIQDRIRENLDDLKVAMIDQKGSFFLCGPTWPVPDITSALEDIISADAKERNVKVDLNEAIEELKETSRYILEVY